MLLLLLAPMAQALQHPAASSCNAPCEIKADKPVDLSLRACEGGALAISTYNGKSLNQGGGSPGCSFLVADFWTVAVGEDVYTTGDLDNALRMTRTDDRQSLTQSFQLNKFGEDVVLQAEYTLVRNGTVIVYRLHNHDEGAVDVGFKYSWDLELDGGNDPKIWVHNRPGDGRGPPNTYGEYDVSLGPPSNDIEYVKVWQTRNGPDGPGDLKQYFWWAERWGGTPPDLVQYMDSGRALEQGNSFTFQADPDEVITESEMQTYFGRPDLIPLAPDDGKEGGADEREFVIWMGTGVPEPLLAYRLEANFPQRGPDATFATAFIDAGGKAQYPIRVKSLTGAPGGPGFLARYRLDVVAQQLPAGWSAQLLDDNNGQPVTETVLGTGDEGYFRLVVSAPEDAFGKDAARVLVRVSYADEPQRVYNRRNSVFEVPLATTTIIRPQYGIGLEGPDYVIPLPAGESVEVPVRVTNLGNLRDPFAIDMDFAGGCTDLAKEMAPQTFSLARGQWQDVRVRLSAPTDALGGEQSCTLRATEPHSQQSNRTALRVRIVGDSDIAITVDQDDLLLPPGSTAAFRATVHNLGFDDADLALLGSAATVCAVTAPASECSEADTWGVVVDTGAGRVRLPPGGHQRVTVHVTAPADAKSGEQRAVLLAAAKDGAASPVAEALVRAIVQRVSTLTGTVDEGTRDGEPGETLVYQVAFHNGGNAVEELTVEMSRLPAGWTAVISPERFPLADGHQRTVSVRVTSPPGTLAGPYALLVQARNADHQQSSAVELQARIAQVWRAQLGTQTPLVRSLPNGELDVLFDVTNRGNTPDAFALSGLPDGWQVTVEPAQTPLLAPGQATVMRLRGNVGPDIGTHLASLVAVSLASGDAASEPLPFTLLVGRPDLAIRAVRLLSPAAHAGDLTVVAAEVENLGAIEARGVRVALLVDGQPTGTFVDFDRLAPDRVLVASLPWTNPGGTHTFRIEVDPLDAIDEGDLGEGNNVAVLRADAAQASVPLLGAEGRLAEQAPGTPILVVLLLLAVLAGARRR